MTVTQKQIDTARENGIQMPIIAAHCSDRVGVPYYVTCAFLEKETSGGQNIYGHDGGATGWFSGRGLVTRDNYAVYKAGRAQHGAQGVGPMQLTYPPFQDAADALGGCWLPVFNITEGLTILKGFVDSGDTWHEAAFHYNGSEQYADEMDVLFEKWNNLVMVKRFPAVEKVIDNLNEIIAIHPTWTGPVNARNILVQWIEDMQ